MSTSSNTSDSFKSIENDKSLILLEECQICRAPAQYPHFGVISCYSCKIFFWRNGNTQSGKFQCNFDGQCEINVNTRRTCISCRLQKCFKSGMSTDLFRPTRNKTLNTKTLVQHQTQLLPTLNLLRSDSSLLTTNQWTLLNNLLHSYNEFHLLTIGQRLTDPNILIEFNHITYQTLMQQFSMSLYETTGTYLRLNDDLSKLSFHDRSLILHNAANNVSCISCAFISHHCQLFNLDIFRKCLIAMCGTTPFDIHQRTIKFIDPDIVLVKLSLALFTLATNNYSFYQNISMNLTNPLSILQIENKYAEITWKYLLYKYGHYQAVQRFFNIILWFQSINVLISHVQTIPEHLNDINSLVEQTELTLILDDVDHLIQINKTSI